MNRTRTAKESLTNPDVRQSVITPESWLQPLEDYHNWLTSIGQSKETVKLRIYQMRRFAFETQIPPFNVIAEDLIEFLGDNEWSNSTRRAYRSGFRSFYTWASEFGRIGTDPTEKLAQVPIRHGKPRPAPLEVISDAILSADDDTRLMIELAAFAGLRCKEIAATHRRDIAKDKDGWMLMVQGKGDRERVVPLRSHMAHDMLKRPDGYIFPGQVDGHMSSKRIQERVSERLAGNWTAHTLRHHFASAVYITSGNDIRVVQDLLGHSNVSTTQIYTAVARDRLRSAVDTLPTRLYEAD